MPCVFLVFIFLFLKILILFFEINKNTVYYILVESFLDRVSVNATAHYTGNNLNKMINYFLNNLCNYVFRTLL